MKLAYVLVLAGVLIVTAPLEVLLGTRVYVRLRRLLLTLVPVAIVFLAWDLAAIHAHHWSYDARQTLSVRLPGDLPLEEVLFFLVIPTAAILTLEAVRRRRPHWRIGDEDEA